VTLLAVSSAKIRDLWLQHLLKFSRNRVAPRSKHSRSSTESSIGRGKGSPVDNGGSACDTVDEEALKNELLTSFSQISSGASHRDGNSGEEREEGNNNTKDEEAFSVEDAMKRGQQRIQEDIRRQELELGIKNSSSARNSRNNNFNSSSPGNPLLGAMMNPRHSRHREGPPKRSRRVSVMPAVSASVFRVMLEPQKMMTRMEENIKQLLKVLEHFCDAYI